MNEKKDGGSAFPEVISDRDNNGQYDTYSYGGMSLRDYFAGQALVGILANGTYRTGKGVNEKTFDKALAETVYGLADTLIAEREK